MNIRSYEDEAARLIQEEIDWEVLSSILVETGWTRVSAAQTSALTPLGEHEVKTWCRQNLKGHYKARGSNWIFELKNDAVWFSLRWS